MSQHPFAELTPTPATDFSLHCYAAILSALEQVLSAFGSHEAAFERFPFLAGYLSELAAAGLEGMAIAEAERWWYVELSAWEARHQGHLPLRALKEAGVGYDALVLLLTVGLIEEDARFGPVFEFLQNRPGQHRPTLGLLDAWWRGGWWQETVWREGQGQYDSRAALRTLQTLGLVQTLNVDAPRLEWTFEVPALVWDALRGDASAVAAPWLRLRPRAELTTLAEMIAPETVVQQVAALPSLLQRGQINTVIVRGPQQNGRRTLLGALAHKLNRSLLIVEGLRQVDDPHWRAVGVLATLLAAMPVVTLDLGPGETAQLPELKGYGGPLGIVLGKQGGVSGAQLDGVVTLAMELPTGAARALHWQAGLVEAGWHEAENVEAAARLRMSSGNLRRTAKLAAAVTALAGRTTITGDDIVQASRTRHRQALETLATLVTGGGDWGELAVNGETQGELQELELRCRFREELHGAVGTTLGSQLNVGVRALLSGPSGTGKTLAARLLASSLQMDLYRVDLSTVVNKYIGETEKNLNQLFTRAEELDVILLLDEGDALLTQRTQVQSSNDRYANLETNYLLQRIEQFEGILLVTTNAGDRIDRAFQRRMDVVIDFRPPDAQERWAIWQMHLPPAHRVDDDFLQEVAMRCALTGGQIRNAALHAALLALDEGGALNSRHLEEAVQREYRKSGAVCPLRGVYRVMG